MRNATVMAFVVFCVAGIVMGRTPSSGTSAPSANYHPQVSSDIAALQAQERSALARGDVAAARELERQVQAILIQQQHAVPQSGPVVVVKPGRAGTSLTPTSRFSQAA